MKPIDLIVPVLLIIGAVLVAPHLTWADARPMAQICLVVAFVFMIFLWWVRWWIGRIDMRRDPIIDFAYHAPKPNKKYN